MNSLWGRTSFTGETFAEAMMVGVEDFCLQVMHDIAHNDGSIN